MRSKTAKFDLETELEAMRKRWAVKSYAKRHGKELSSESRAAWVAWFSYGWYVPGPVLRRDTAAAEVILGE